MLPARASVAKLLAKPPRSLYTPISLTHTRSRVAGAFRVPCSLTPNQIASRLRLPVQIAPEIDALNGALNGGAVLAEHEETRGRLAAQ